uniref:Ribosome assembly factor mrt4 n=1 Tax=Ditylenchus dipsaci TaxID=166011 RepID=A0A915DNE4_9BILA
MPSSKRDKVVSLTKVKKKTKEGKLSLIEEIRKSVTDYANLFVFSMENLRGTKFVQIRQKFKATSRFFFGKNNLVSVALGRSDEDEVEKDLHKVSQMLKGECGLLFSNEKIKDIKKYFKEFSEVDFSRAGTKVDRTVELPEGPLKGIAGSMEPLLRKLGLPTKLEQGHVELLKNYVVCNAGDVLTPDQAAILKIFDIKTVNFKVVLKAQWSKSKGFKEIIV